MVTYRFDPGDTGEPYVATIRVRGRRVGTGARLSATDTFTHDETVRDVIPGTGAVAVTSWIYGIDPGERRVDLHLDIEDRALAVRADRDRLAQVLDNLLSNALRYSPDGGRVSISARRVDDGVRLSITDEGPGLTVEQRERVFERFYRVDPSRSRALGGSGIGLAIARALVDAMGGRIWVESDGEGRGSTFRLELPAA